LKQKPSFYRIVQKDIQSVEQLIIESIQMDRPDVNILLKQLFTSGGKRIRPNIALLLGKMLGAENRRIITLSSAIEMLHTATLVHDDLIDNSLFRRGNTTLNAIWTPAATVLAGDYLFAKAAEHAANTDSLVVMKLFSQTLSIIVRGEITQFLEKNNSLELQDYYDRIYAKTASLFQTTSISTGILAGTAPAEVEELKLFGHDIGMAFQIIDDVLDFTGEQQTLGKPIGSDLRNNILTLPSLLYFQDHKKEYKQFIKDTKSNGQGIRDVLIQNILAGSVIEKSIDQAKTFIHQGLNHLDAFPSSEFKTELKALTLDSLTRVQ
jgi:geranylgeranyl pyrophosphate synthase